MFINLTPRSIPMIPLDSVSQEEGIEPRTTGISVGQSKSLFNLSKSANDLAARFLFTFYFWWHPTLPDWEFIKSIFLKGSQ
jgi:hypothetical protein